MCSFRNINCSYYNITYPHFKFMYINNNNITELHEDLFTSLPNIKKINLSYNRITSISYYLFINNNKLEEIFLSYNIIKIFIVELAHISHLRILNLIENPIETFHEGTLKNFFIRNKNNNKIMGVSLINKIICDCNMHWIQRITDEIEIQQFYFENNRLINLTSFLILYTNLENISNLNNIGTKLTGYYTSIGIYIYIYIYVL